MVVLDRRKNKLRVNLNYFIKRGISMDGDSDIKDTTGIVDITDMDTIEVTETQIPQAHMNKDIFISSIEFKTS